MSLQYARSAAEKLVAAIPHAKWPIDPEKIARQLGVPVVSDDLGNEISGMLVTKNGHATIFYNKKHRTNNRHRFTIAHELGHHCLRHDSSSESIHVDKDVRVMLRSSRASEGVATCEIEANQFAASLLMPVNLIREAVEKRNGPSLSEKQVEELADDFKVSVQAMTIRLSHLGYL